MLRVCALAGVVALVVLPGSARAAVVTAKDSVPLPEAQGPVGTATAECPAGTNLVSGGFQSTAGIAWVLESRRVGTRSWRVTAGRFTNDLTPSTLTAFAYCDRKARRATAVTVDVNGMVTNEVAGETSTCPGEKRAVAGGFRVDATDTSNAEAVVNGSFRSGGQSWRTEIYSFTDSALVEGIAYCARQRLRTKSRAAQIQSDEDSVINVRTPRCRGTRSVGFRAGDPGQENPIAVDRLIRKKKRGIGRGHDADETGEPLRIFAYCPSR